MIKINESVFIHTAYNFTTIIRVFNTWIIWKKIF